MRPIPSTDLPLTSSSHPAFVLRPVMLLGLLLLIVAAAPAWSQDDLLDEPAVAEEVAVQAQVGDAEIAARLSEILRATSWFADVSVRVDAGVVFLNALVESAEHRAWAERLAENTEGVVAVVNRIEISSTPVWDFTPALTQFHELVNAAIRHSPMLLMSFILLILTWFFARLAARGARALLQPRVKSRLLQDVLARILAIPVFLIGLYLVLSVSGLTGLAVTVIGSTGLLGLVLGFAFRDIAENFLASVLISMNRPFATGDRIEVEGFDGIVQSVNTRSTLLMTLDGNHVQIPNATIYKSTITNYTANPRARFDFTLGIGYEDAIAHAQAVALEVLKAHPAVIDEPESLVLVDELGAATVNLRVYFWVDVARFSPPKVRSAVIRQITVAFTEAGISMPDEAREVVFPQGVPVQMLEKHADLAPAPEAPAPTVHVQPAAGEATEAEGDYASDTEEIEKQARESRNPEGGENLLES